MLDEASPEQRERLKREIDTNVAELDALVEEVLLAGRLDAGVALPRLPAFDGPVLLVDDYVDSGWTMALAARALRLAGAPMVLPFALALNG